MRHRQPVALANQIDLGQLWLGAEKESPALPTNSKRNDAPEAPESRAKADSPREEWVVREREFPHHPSIRRSRRQHVVR